MGIYRVNGRGLSVKTRTVIERIGEYLGPIDWSFDFAQFDWSERHGGVNPTVSAEAIARLRQLEQPGEWQVMMHQNYLRVLRVGMYDGWPFWRPVPSVQTYHVLGSSWHPWYDIQAVERIGASPAVDAVDPQASSTGNLTTRDKE